MMGGHEKDSKGENQLPRFQFAKAAVVYLRIRGWREDERFFCLTNAAVDCGG